MDMLTGHVYDLIVLILTGVLTVGIAYLKKAVENSQFKNSLDTTLETIDAVAKDAIQNVGSVTKEALKDGKISAEEKETIKKAAKTEFNNIVSPKLTGRLNVHINDVDKFVTKKINTIVETSLTDIEKK